MERLLTDFPETKSMSLARWHKDQQFDQTHVVSVLYLSTILRYLSLT